MPVCGRRPTAPTRRAARCVQKVRERNTHIETELLFFDLEWSELEDDIAERLLADPALERYAAVLRSERRYKPYQLTEPEELISTEKSVTGVARLGRLFNELPGRPARLVRRPGAVARRGAVEAGTVDRPGRARPGRGGGHRDAPPGRSHAGLRAEHDPERARDRGPAPRLRQLDLRAQPLERDPGRCGGEPRRRDRLAVRHPAALLRAEDTPARLGAAA